jgi:5-deoxy-glucuronate isomerase
MSHLLRHKLKGSKIHDVTPKNAGWSHVGFAVYDLADGQTLSLYGEDTEYCLVLVAGRASIVAGDTECGTLGARTSPFDGLPWSVYVPPHTPVSVTGVGAVELAVCSAPAKGGKKVTVIPPSDIAEMDRGSGTNLRHVRNILPDTSTIAENLLVVEVITPGGHWSSYPPHKHDTDDVPNETYLEETYYHRLKRGSGFAIQRVYTKDGTLDETMAISDRDVVLVPKGYHPVGAPHGFDLYYLNVMAGPVKSWKFTMDPDHAHLPY